MSAIRTKRQSIGPYIHKMPLQMHNSRISTSMILSDITEKKRIRQPSPKQPSLEQQLPSDRFLKLKFLGKGKYSDVFQGYDRVTGLIVALKVIQKSIIARFNLNKLILSEIKIQSSLDHPNILKLYTVLSDDKQVVLVQEFAEQELTTYRGNVSQIVSQLASAVAYLHERKILHRDLKPENILITQGNVKLGDFGLAVKSKGKLTEYCGTPTFMAPEVAGRQQYDESADVYSLGLIIKQLCPKMALYKKLTEEDPEKRMTAARLSQLLPRQSNTEFII